MFAHLDATLVVFAKVEGPEGSADIVTLQACKPL